ncbi:MAG: tetratricopeptide repeat protein, partial [Gammaproteobacteria bacterium]|nr:tetratricopeptide repeat protein [Gammaproteobacteria bacterium]
MRSLFKYFKIIPLGIIVIMLISCGGAEERKEKYLEKGKAYLEEKNIDKARIEFKNVLQIDPKFSDAYYYLGKVEEQSKEFQKALGYYVKAIDIDSNHVEAKIEVARVYLMIGTEEYINKSSKLIKEIFSKEPENVKAKLIASTIEYKTGNKNKAVDDLEKIVNENKKLIEGISILASIYESVGEENKLLNLLERSVADNGNNAQLRAMLAKIYIKRKYINKAENQLLEMIKINPDEYQYKVMIAAFYSANDQEQKAEDILRDAIKQDPD